MSRHLTAASPAELAAIIDIVRTIADTVKSLTELRGGVSSGELYAYLNAAGMTIVQYGAVIETLEGAGVIEVANSWIKFTGRTE